MAILGAVIVPHPPLILPGVGRGEQERIRRTTAAFKEAAELAASWRPEALIVATPHTVCYADYFHISPGSGANGDMSAFGAPGLRLGVKYDGQLREAVTANAAAAGIRAGTLGEKDPALDHGTFIPLHFFREAGLDVPILRVGLSGFSGIEHYRLGECIAKAARELGRRAVFVASGDLSHRLREDGPYGFDPAGPEFDGMVTRAMESGGFLDFLTLPPSLAESAAECGLRSFEMMAGALDGLSVRPSLMSYEGPFGVGYAVASFEVLSQDESRRFGAQWTAAERARLSAVRLAEDEYVRLARLSLEHSVREGRPLSGVPAGLPAELTGAAAGAFVSLHRQGQLRGCIGTTAPVCSCTAEEIIRNAALAGLEDPRFDPVEEHELDELEYKVDVLGRPEPIDSMEQLDVKRYGVIVSHRSRRGLLLPDLEGVDSVERQVEIALRKAGISPKLPYRMERFEVVRHR